MLRRKAVLCQVGKEELLESTSISSQAVLLMTVQAVKIPEDKDEVLGSVVALYKPVIQPLSTVICTAPLVPCRRSSLQVPLHKGVFNLSLCWR